jgi:hypothetical protein
MGCNARRSAPWPSQRHASRAGEQNGRMSFDGVAGAVEHWAGLVSRSWTLEMNSRTRSPMVGPFWSRVTFGVGVLIPSFLDSATPLIVD